MLKVAIVHNLPSGGSKRALYELGTRLAPRMHLEVFCPEGSDEDYLPSSDWARAVRRYDHRSFPPLRLRLWWNDIREIRGLLELLSTYRRIARDIESEGFDVLFAHPCQILGAPAVFRALGRVPSAYYCAEPPRHFYEPIAAPRPAEEGAWVSAREMIHAPARSLIGRWLKDTDRLNARAATRLLTNSRYSRDVLRQVYGRCPYVAYLGVDTGRFQLNGAGRSGNLVLSVGALLPLKGFEFLIESLAGVPAPDRPQLAIVSNITSASHRRTLERLASECGVKTVFRQGVSEGELISWYHRSRLLVYAPHHEPFGLVPLEAMATGLPVVAIDEAGPAESVVPGETGLLLPRNAGVWARALSRLLANEGRRRSMGTAGRRLVESRWSWDAAAERIEHHLRATAETRSAG